MQKIDFGVLSVVRQNLIRGAVGASCGVTEANLYTAVPRTLEHGETIVLDLEEAWHFSPEEVAEGQLISPLRATTSSMVGKVVFRLIVLSTSISGSEALDVANQARFMLDGATLSLGEPKNGKTSRRPQQLEATFRMVSNIVDLKKRRDLPRKVEQLYEVLIHKKHVTKSIRGTKSVGKNPSLSTVSSSNAKKSRVFSLSHSPETRK